MAWRNAERLNLTAAPCQLHQSLARGRPALAGCGNGAAAKAGLNRSILETGWAQFLQILANKAESAGRLVVPVNARNTSRTCPECGHISQGNRLTQAKFQCTACGFTANADHVGVATNVLNRAGLVLCDVA